MGATCQVTTSCLQSMAATEKDKLTVKAIFNEERLDASPKGWEHSRDVHSHTAVQSDKARGEVKDIKFENEIIKLALFTGSMTVYIENPRESPRSYGTNKKFSWSQDTICKTQAYFSVAEIKHWKLYFYKYHL